MKTQVAVMKTDWSAAVAVAAMLAAGSAAAQTSAAPPPPRTASSAAAETLDYVVQRGDTLIDLATAYMNRPLDYRRVQRENRVADPRRLSIGRTLALPVDLLRADPDEARIAGFRGAATLNQDGRS
ncbi:LysM peptidoglycan-binding domain-containing protein, partial [Brevundimonas sp.]|uniref:LysM peptidoglycan-binding domain-containing protein n=1 Tax=Brevundimonas sp. TaxID=1871086 RepID=UPI0028A68F0B